MTKKKDAKPAVKDAAEIDDKELDDVQGGAYSPNFSGGVRVAAGDITGDGRDEIVTGKFASTAGGSPNI